MKTRHSWRSVAVVAMGSTLALGSSWALAAEHGGGHGGGAVGGHSPAGHVGGYGGYRGGYGYGGYRGGYGYGGYRGGYYGWRGGYYGGWGWGLGGLGLGLYFATLPLYYNTLWWDGIPYYYANNTYYVYDGNVGQYQTVAPPPGLDNQAAAQLAPAAGTDLIAYPKNGQSTEQQSKDKYECHHWASTQSGFDPSLGSGAAGASANQRSDYLRAQAACLEGRGYSVK